MSGMESWYVGLETKNGGNVKPGRDFVSWRERVTVGFPRIRNSFSINHLSSVRRTIYSVNMKIIHPTTRKLSTTRACLHHTFDWQQCWSKTRTFRATTSSMHQTHFHILRRNGNNKWCKTLVQVLYSSSTNDIWSEEVVQLLRLCTHKNRTQASFAVIPAYSLTFQ